MAGSPTPPVAPSEGRAASPIAGQLVGGVPTPPTAADEGTLAGPASVTPDGGSPAQPNVGSVGIDGSTDYGFKLKSGPGIALTKNGNSVQVSVDQSGGADVPVGDLIPGASNTVAVTNSAGTAAQFSLITNANIDPAAAISPSKIAIAGAVTIPGTNIIDWSAGSVFEQSLAAGANAFTFASSTDGQTITVRLTSDAGGSTVSWPGATQFAGGSDPTQTTPSGTDIYTFVNVKGTIYGSVVQNFS